MSSNQPPRMSLDELYQYLARRLGAPRRDISELTQENFCDSYESALLWFNAKKGLRKEKILNITSGKNTYSIFDEIGEDVDTIIDVNFQSSRYDISSLYSYGMFPDQGFPLNFIGATSYAGGYSCGPYSTLVQSMQYIEMAKRVTGSEPDYQVVGNTLYIYPMPITIDGSTTVGKIMVTYKTKDIHLDKLNERDYDLIKRYMLAFLKKDLGMIRDRYGSTFISAGGQTANDGARLLQEAEKEFAVLEQEIEMSGFPMQYLIG